MNQKSLYRSTHVVLIVRTLSFLFGAVYTVTFCGKDLTILNVMLVLFHLSFFACDVAGIGSWDLFQYQIRCHILRKEITLVFFSCTYCGVTSQLVALKSLSLIWHQRKKGSCLWSSLPQRNQVGVVYYAGGFRFIIKWFRLAFFNYLLIWFRVVIHRLSESKKNIQPN